MAWLREEQPEVAVERILDAAEKAFIEHGVSATGMARVAEYAGCSRGTLYRYFKTRHDLHVAYVNRTALAIVERVGAQVAPIEDPRKRLVESILASIREVRASPGAAAWFEPSVSGTAARVSRSSEVVEAFTAAFAAEQRGGQRAAAESRLAARWLTRVIVSLLATPGESEAEERELVERYAIAGLLPTP